MPSKEPLPSIATSCGRFCPSPIYRGALRPMRLLPLFSCSHSADRFWFGSRGWLRDACFLSAVRISPSIAPDVAEARRNHRLESNIASRRTPDPHCRERVTVCTCSPAMSPSAAQSAPAGRCDGVCVAAQSICGYSRRICTCRKNRGRAKPAELQNAERECSDAKPVRKLSLKASRKRPSAGVTPRVDTPPPNPILRAMFVGLTQNDFACYEPRKGSQTSTTVSALRCGKATARAWANTARTAC